MEKVASSNPTPDNAKRCSVGLVQMRMDEDRAVNLDVFCKRARDAAQKGAQIIVSPELFLTPYFCQEENPACFDLAEPIPGPTSQKLSDLARELSVVIVASLFERRQAGIYHNTAVGFGPDGEMLGRYRKNHIPDDPLYFEKYYFTPGDLGFPVWKTPWGSIGVLVCWDQWFPESARLMVLGGAEILIYPTAIGWHEHEKDAEGKIQRDAWETVQRGHAISNGVYLCAVNRVGWENSVQFYGQSFIADPMGQILHRADIEEEEVIVKELDLSKIEETRRNWPFLRDRRIDAYGDLLLRSRLAT